MRKSQLKATSPKSQAKSLSVLRISTGSEFPFLWSKDEPHQTFVDKGLAIQDICRPIEGNHLFVNELRYQELKKAKSDWIWMLDSDVIPSLETFKQVHQFIQCEPPGIIGGLYHSEPNQGLWNKSYNRMCNLWSLSRETPLAGNLLIHRSLIDHLHGLDQIEFSQEENFIKEVALRKKWPIKVLPFFLTHKNNKSFFGFFRQALFHRSKKRTPPQPTPWKSYLKHFVTDLYRSPLETTLAGFYFFIISLPKFRGRV